MNDQLKAAEPKSILLKPIKVESFSSLFNSLIGLAVYGVTFQWTEVAKSLAEGVEALGLETDIEEYTWKLVNLSMGKAVYDLATEFNNEFALPPDNALGHFTEELLSQGTVSIEQDFFEHPTRNKIVDEMGEVLAKWLRQAQIEESKIKTTLARLPAFFTWALHDEWRNDPINYQKIFDHFNTPFAKASQYEHDWDRYRAWLDKQINERVFGEAFGLNQLYVPLAVYHVNKDAEAEERDEEVKTVVDLEEYLDAWLDRNDPKESFKVIMGGPGSGKSSFCKIFAARQASRRRVIYIPLHHIDADRDLTEAIGAYLRNSLFFKTNPYEEQDKLFVIFDGLDELAEQGKDCADVAKQFIDAVQKDAGIKNQVECRLKVLFTGRDVVVQSNTYLFRKPEEKIHLLSYWIDPDQREKYWDAKDILKKDKRDEWWHKFGLLTKVGYQGLPPELINPKLNELTAQPLLNYLVALSYYRKTMTFGEDTNLNSVYNNLIGAVHQRGWSSEGQLSPVSWMSEDDFFLVLEEIAVAAWHGSGRTATLQDIEKRCQRGRCDDLLKQFEEGARAGITNLLTAFYFRQSETQRGGEATFEFTHKSFSEYLLAKRLVRQLKLSQELLAERKDNRHKGWSEETCLEEWALLCGPTALDGYIYAFLRDEVSLFPKDSVLKWQQALAHLIGNIQNAGLPFEKISEIQTFFDKTKQSRNAEEALLAAHSACASWTNEVSNIAWEAGLNSDYIKVAKSTKAGEWINKLRGQRQIGRSFPLGCLNHINFSRCILEIIDLYGADLTRSIFIDTSMRKAIMRSASLAGADLRAADLREADLQSSRMPNVNLQGASLQGANLKRSDLLMADLQGAVLQGSNLLKANLSEANLRGADLQRANLRGADLYGADLWQANLQDANLGEAKLHGADLREADLQGAVLRETDLQGADLQGANLLFTTMKKAVFIKANFKRTDLHGVNFQSTDLREADLHGAVLQGANLKGANLQGANLQEADLQGAILWSASMNRTNLRGAILQDAIMMEAVLPEADLQGLNLRGANLHKADLQNANLQGADLQGAILHGAILQGAYLYGTNLRGAQYSEDDLKGAYVHEVIFD